MNMAVSDGINPRKASDSVEPLDITESVREFAMENGDYYAREFRKIQSRSGISWSLNRSAILLGPVWATTRGLWGLFWTFSILELLVIAVLGQGLWGDLGAEKQARADRLQESHERMLGRLETARSKGDEEGATSFREKADKLLQARERALDEAEELQAGGRWLAVIGLIGLVLVKLFEGLVANAGYEKQYSRWRTDRSIRAGISWPACGMGLLIVCSVYPVTLLYFTTGSPPGFITEFPMDKSFYLITSAWIDEGFDFASNHFAFFFQGISRGVRMILGGIEILLVETPWPVVMIVIVVLAHKSAGARVAVLTAAALIYVAVFGFWERSMSTVALLGTASLLCIVIGMPFGVWFARSDRAFQIARPILDLMQTMPAFVYLIPIIAFFGTGKPPGIIASMIFGLPPIIRLTTLGLRGVPKPITEAARAFGATDRQILVGVEVPLAMPSIMTGVNQTILMCLSLVVIAALIDAKGLGYDVLVALQYAAKGQGILAGLAILFCAIVIDRVIQGRFKYIQQDTS